MPRKNKLFGQITTSPFIHLIHVKSSTPPLSADKQSVVDKLKELLERAEKGEIHGLCFSVSNEDSTYEADCVGCYEKYPTDALGPLDVLKLKLTRKALDEQWHKNNY